MAALSIEQIRLAVHRAEQRLLAVHRGDRPSNDLAGAQRALKAARTRLERTTG